MKWMASFREAPFDLWMLLQCTTIDLSLMAEIVTGRSLESVSSIYYLSTLSSLVISQTISKVVVDVDHLGLYSYGVQILDRLWSSQA